MTGIQQQQQQQQPMAPYSLFNRMWSANLQHYPHPPREGKVNEIPSVSML